MPLKSVKRKKHDPEFMACLKEHLQLDRATGNVSFKNMYASVYLNIGWKGGIISVPHSHLVWFAKHRRWPKEGFFIDHINSDPMDNRPSNLQEITEEENHKKRRGRIVHRSYGSGKYGYGFHIFHDKRDARYYITRYLSRGYGKGDLKNIKRGLGGFDTLKEAEKYVTDASKQIELHGLDFMPDPAPRKYSPQSSQLTAAGDELLQMRKRGMTIEEIVEATGFSQTTVYNRVRHLGVDKRKK